MATTPPSPLRGLAPSDEDPSLWMPGLRSAKDSAPFMVRHLISRKLAGSAVLPPILRIAVLCALGVRFARPLSLSRVAWLDVVVDCPGHLTVGGGVNVSMGCFFEGDGDISLGDDSALGPQVTVLTSAHLRRSDGCIDRHPTYQPVTVGHASFIGARSVLMPNVTIGDSVTIAAGAVVTTDCIAPGVYGGVPARRIK